MTRRLFQNRKSWYSNLFRRTEPVQVTFLEIGMHLNKTNDKKKCEIVLQLLLLVFVIVQVIWYFWNKYSPYSSMHSLFFTDWRLILMILRGKGPQNKPLSVVLFRLIADFCKKHLTEGMAVLWFPEPVLVVYGPEATKFFANEPSLIDKPWVYKFFDSLGKDGIFRSSGKRAKRQRKLSSPAFYPSMMKNYVTTMNEHATYLVQELKQLENHTTKDLGKIIKTRTLMLFFEAALGIKTGSAAEDSRIDGFIKPTTNIMDFVVYRLYRPWLHFDFMLHFSSDGRSHIKDVKDLHVVVKQIVEELKESYDLRKLSNSNSRDPERYEQHKKAFGDVLLEEHLKDPSFSIKDVETDVISLITAGYDTASYSLMWTLWLLGLHQDIQEKAYEEIKSVANETVDYEDIRNLTYIECIIKESLRLYPVVPVFARLSNKDLYFDGYKIPCGTTIGFIPYVLHRNPELYPEPETFNPDRFAEMETNVKPWTFIPFGESVRSCIGKNYAMLEMKVLLAHVIRNFKIVSLTPREDVEVSWEIMLKSSIPLSVKFIPR